MRTALFPAMALVGALAACTDAPAPEANAAAATIETNLAAFATPEPVRGDAALTAVDPPGAALDRWLTGTWSLDEYCGSSDFAITYRADGGLDNSGQLGRWSLEGDRLTETITESIPEGADAPARLATPETRSYTVRRIDQRHGLIVFEGRDIPILRC